MTKYRLPLLAVLLISLAFPTLALAQDEDASGMPVIQDSATEAANNDARDVMEQAEESMPRIRVDSVQQGENAGSMTGTIIGNSGSSHTESRSESSSTSFSIGTDTNEVAHPEWSPGTPGSIAVSPSMVFGQWTLSTNEGQSCAASLKDTNFFGGFMAYLPSNCPAEFFPVRRWAVSGNQLQLTDTNGHVIARFWTAGRDRWVGHSESNGAHLSLTRN